AIERREITRIGGTKEVAVDVRFVSATHRDLARAIADGRFREDLFYRLNGVSLVVPPLRDRAGEIRLLAERFLAAACGKLARPKPTVAPDVFVALERYPWPGNVRELRNVMDRAALLCTSDMVLLDHVALDGSGPISSVVSPPSHRDGPGERLVRELEEV